MTVMFKKEHRQEYQTCIEKLSYRYDLQKISGDAFETLSARVEHLPLFSYFKLSALVEAHFIRRQPSDIIYCLTAIEKIQASGDDNIGVIRKTEPYDFYLTWLNDDFGKIIIRPESLSDKIQEIFFAKEIDFKDNPYFSSRYYMTADDEESSRRLMNNGMLDAIANVDDLYLQFRNKIMIAKRNKPLSVRNCLDLAEFSVKFQNAHFEVEKWCSKLLFPRQSSPHNFINLIGIL